MAPPFWLETTRLALRRFTLDDRAWLVSLFADPDVTRHIGGTKTAADVDDLLRTRILDYYDRHPGLGMWATVERATGRCLGFHLLNHPPGESFIQVGFVLDRAAWGQRYATEGAAALLRYGFVDLALPRIAGITTLTNVASQRVLEKIGLDRRGERLLAHPAYAAQGPLAFFEREREEWLAERAGPDVDRSGGRA